MHNLFPSRSASVSRVTVSRLSRYWVLSHSAAESLTDSEPGWVWGCCCCCSVLLLLLRYHRLYSLKYRLSVRRHKYSDWQSQHFSTIDWNVFFKNIQNQYIIIRRRGLLVSAVSVSLSGTDSDCLGNSLGSLRAYVVVADDIWPANRSGPTALRESTCGESSLSSLLWSPY